MPVTVSGISSTRRSRRACLLPRPATGSRHLIATVPAVMRVVINTLEALRGRHKDTGRLVILVRLDGRPWVRWSRRHVGIVVAVDAVCWRDMSTISTCMLARSALLYLLTQHITLDICVPYRFRRQLVFTSIVRVSDMLICFLCETLFRDDDRPSTADERSDTHAC
jgi:hypothetical protein